MSTNSSCSLSSSRDPVEDSNDSTSVLQILQENSVPWNVVHWGIIFFANPFTSHVANVFQSPVLLCTRHSCMSVSHYAVFLVCIKAVHMQCSSVTARFFRMSWHQYCNKRVHNNNYFTVSQDTMCVHMILSQCPILCASEIFQVLFPVPFLLFSLNS